LTNCYEIFVLDQTNREIVVCGSEFHSVKHVLENRLLTRTHTILARFPIHRHQYLYISPQW